MTTRATAAAERERRRAERPARVDVAEVVDAEVDAREPDQGGHHHAADDQRGARAPSPAAGA